jgi:hypothetical protein
MPLKAMTWSIYCATESCGAAGRSRIYLTIYQHCERGDAADQGGGAETLIAAFPGARPGRFCPVSRGARHRPGEIVRTGRSPGAARSIHPKDGCSAQGGVVRLVSSCKNTFGAIAPSMQLNFDRSEPFDVAGISRRGQR